MKKIRSVKDEVAKKSFCAMLKKMVTMPLDNDALDYFKGMAKDSDGKFVSAGLRSHNIAK